MISKTDFISAITDKKSHHEWVNELYKLGVDISNGINMTTDFFYEYMSAYFDEDGVDLIEWWLFEPVEKYIYSEYKEGDERKVIADLTKADDLYDYLIKNHTANGWKKCEEEDYPEYGDCKLTVVRLYNTVDNHWDYWLYSDCPYGWGVLVRNGAEYICNMKNVIDEAIFNKINTGKPEFADITLNFVSDNNFALRDFGFDSLDIMETIVECEWRLDKCISDDLIHNVNTKEDVYKLFENAD